MKKLFVACLATSTAFCSALVVGTLGYQDAPDHDWSSTRAWDRTTDMLDELSSFGGVIALILLTLVVVGGLFYMSHTDYKRKVVMQWTHIVLGLVIIGIIAAIGINGVDSPNLEGWLVLGFAGTIIAQAAAFTWLARPRGIRPRR